jgi:hypothetical protein
MVASTSGRRLAPQEHEPGKGAGVRPAMPRYGQPVSRSRDPYVVMTLILK